MSKSNVSIKLFETIIFSRPMWNLFERTVNLYVNVSDAFFGFRETDASKESTPIEDWFTRALSSAASATLGGLFYGTQGAIAGVGLIAADEYLMNHKATSPYYNKHLLTSTALWSSMAIPAIKELAAYSSVVSTSINTAPAMPIVINNYFAPTVMNDHLMSVFMNDYLGDGKYDALILSGFALLAAAANIVFKVPALMSHALPALSVLVAAGVSYSGKDIFNYRATVEGIITPLVQLSYFFDEKEVFSSKTLNDLKLAIQEEGLLALVVSLSGAFLADSNSSLINFVNDISGAFNRKQNFDHQNSYVKEIVNRSSTMQLVIKDIEAVASNKIIVNTSIIALINFLNSIVDVTLFNWTCGNSDGATVSRLLAMQQSGGSVMMSILSSTTIGLTYLAKEYLYNKFVSQHINDLRNEMKSTMIDEILRKVLLDPVNSLKILKALDPELYTKTLMKDALSLETKISHYLDDLISSFSKFNALYHVVIKIPEIAFVHSVMSLIERSYAAKMAVQFNNIGMQEQDCENHMSSLISAIGLNFEKITLTDGAGSFLRAKCGELNTKIQSMKAEKNGFTQNSLTSQKLAAEASKALKAGLWLHKILQGLGIDQIPILQSHLSVVNDLLLGGGYFRTMEFGGTGSELRLKELFKVIKSHKSKNKIMYKTHDKSESVVKINHYKLTVDGKTAVTQSDGELVVKSGEWIFITGNNGTGKTSFLKELLGCSRPSEKFYSEGEISIHKGLKLVYLGSQILSIPHTTLFDLIMLDHSNIKSEPASLKKDLIDLLKAFKLFNLDKIEDENEMIKMATEKLDSKDYQLSDGEKKKCAIAGTILRNKNSLEPLLIILDETLTGLDPKSIVILQKALKYHLPNASIILMDHEIRHHNDGRLFNAWIDFNKPLTVKTWSDFLESLSEQSPDNCEYKSDTVSSAAFLPSCSLVNDDRLTELAGNNY